MKKPVWYGDYLRTTDDDRMILSHFLRDWVFQHRLRFMVYFRWAQATKLKTVKLFCDYMLYRYSRKYGLEIKSNTSIGAGFVMTHPYNITIASNAVLGKNVTMLKGATVGMSPGKRSGVPKIGNNVYIGINSTIVGGIEIGDDVLIGPNTFVNEDVPSHSVVIGNPCRIIHKEQATKELIFNGI